MSRKSIVARCVPARQGVRVRSGRSCRRSGGAAGRRPASDPVGPVTQQVAALPVGDMADRLCESERQASWVELWESRSPEAVPRTDAQRTELDRRLDDLKQDAPTG